MKGLYYDARSEKHQKMCNMCRLLVFYGPPRYVSTDFIKRYTFFCTYLCYYRQEIIPIRKKNTSTLCKICALLYLQSLFEIFFSSYKYITNISARAKTRIKLSEKVTLLLCGFKQEWYQETNRVQVHKIKYYGNTFSWSAVVKFRQKDKRSIRTFHCKHAKYDPCTSDT